MLVLLKSLYKKLTPSNSNSDPLILFCKFSSYFFNNDSKSYSIISSLSSPNIISILSLLVYVIRVSSEPGFSDIKLTSIVNCTFHSPFSLYSSNSSLKYFSIRLKYSLRLNILSPLLSYRA